MVPDISTAHRIADVDDMSVRVLAGPQRPIVLMPRLATARVADSVAPHNPDLGVMLAYTPMQHCCSDSRATSRDRPYW